MKKVSLTTIVVFTAVAFCFFAATYGKPTLPARGVAATEFIFNPPVESVKFRHPAFTTISCSTRSGLTMSEPPTAGTVTGFSTAPAARIALCISDKPMVQVP